MAATQRVLFCDDLLFQICLHATPLTLWSVRLTAKAFGSVTRRVTTAIVKASVRPFTGDVHEFFRVLDQASGVVGGDVVVDVVGANLPIRPLSSSILSVFVPFGGAESMRAVFMGWGYGRIPLVGYSIPDEEMYMVTGTLLHVHAHYTH